MLCPATIALIQIPLGSVHRARIGKCVLSTNKWANNRIIRLRPFLLLSLLDQIARSLLLMVDVIPIIAYALDRAYLNLRMPASFVRQQNAYLLICRNLSLFK